MTISDDILKKINGSDDKETHFINDNEIDCYGDIELEKGKYEGGIHHLSPFELDLFHKGYKIVSDFEVGYEFTKYVDVYNGNELYCKIIHHCQSSELRVTYYKNGKKLKRNWYYYGGEKQNDSSTFYDKNGDKFIYYSMKNLGSTERLLYKGEYRNKEILDESDLSNYFSEEVISL